MITLPSAKRLNAHVWLSQEKMTGELAHLFLRDAKSEATRNAFNEIVRDCHTVREVTNDLGLGTVVILDVYVLTPKELEDLICTAIREGRALGAEG